MSIRARVAKATHSLTRSTERTAASPLEAADRLVQHGQFDEAIDLLTDANRRTRNPEFEQQLISLRHEAFRHRHHGAPRTVPEPAQDPFPEVAGTPPEIQLDELSSGLLRGAVMHHGCLIVRDFIPDWRCRQLREDTESALDAARRSADPDSEPNDFYVPFPGLDAFDRPWVNDHGTLYAADSPPTFFDLVDTFNDARLGPLFTEYFGERTALSVQKCAVRKVTASTAPEVVTPKGKKVRFSMWHQDGEFLGRDTRAINVWITFSDAGVDAPGIDIVPKRLDHIVETGTDNAGIDWCVGEEMVQRVAGSTPPVRPVFHAGDALFFDEMLLHATGKSADMTKDRVGSEAWFIAESSYPPEKWVPLAF